MLQKLDLASIAEEIVSPYRPIPLVSLPHLEVSLFICQGTRSWSRQVPHDELLLVTEGVITIQGPRDKLVVNEGELVSVPRDAGHNAYSGMRSTVMLIEERRADERSNGHRTIPTGENVGLGKVNVALDVRHGQPFDWLPSGTAGAYGAFATRLLGTSGQYVLLSGSLLVLVYRGILDYLTPDEQGTLVGSQLLVVPPETPIELQSGHGATVIVLVRNGAPLPELASPAPRDSEVGSDSADQ